MLSKNRKKNLRQKRKAERLAEKIQAFKNTGEGQIKLIDKGKSFEIYIQCHLYLKLNLLGYDTRIEMPYKLEGRSQARFDIVIFHPKRDIIIEVKNKGKKVPKSQVTKYAKFEAELLFCIGKEQIDETITYIQEHYPLHG